MKKYKLSGETRTLPWGTVLHRVVATTTFTLACGLTINAGDVGGWIEKESNLSDNAWVADNAWVYDNARVSGDAWVCDNAQVSGCALVYGDTLVANNARVSGDAHVYDHAQIDGDAKVYDKARVFGDAWVFSDAHVFGNAKVYGNAKVCDNAWVRGDAEVVMNEGDYSVFKDSWSSGRYFTWTKSNDMWAEGSFYGTGDELIKKAYADSEDSGKHYEAYVKLVETLKNEEQEK